MKISKLIFTLCTFSSVSQLQASAAFSSNAAGTIENGIILLALRCSGKPHKFTLKVSPKFATITLYAAIESNNLADVRYALANGAKTNLRLKDEPTALELVAKPGCNAEIRTMVEEHKNNNMSST